MRGDVGLVCAPLLAALVIGGNVQARGNGAPGAGGIGDPYYPALGNGGYDARQYALDLAVDMAHDRVTATTTIEAVASQDLSRFSLDFTGFTITNLTIDGARVSYSRQGHKLVITPAHALSRGRLLRRDARASDAEIVAYYRYADPWLERFWQRCVRRQRAERRRELVSGRRSSARQGHVQLRDQRGETVGRGGQRVAAQYRVARRQRDL
jgi:hypothetical protein